MSLNKANIFRQHPGILEFTQTYSEGEIVNMRMGLNHLRKENKRLKMEREIVKKAAAFFAKESA